MRTKSTTISSFVSFIACQSLDYFMLKSVYGTEIYLYGHFKHVNTSYLVVISTF